MMNDHNMWDIVAAESSILHNNASTSPTLNTSDRGSDFRAATVRSDQYEVR